MKIVVIGAGLMGTQIGVEYALGGHDVTLVARPGDGPPERVARACALAEDAGLRSPAEVSDARGRIALVPDPAEVSVAVDLVVESVPEDFAIKVEVLRQAADLFPDAVIASNTSSLSITALGEAIGAAEGTVGTHYWNPPLLMPLVEVVRGERTGRGVVTMVTQTLRALGKRPVAVEQDVPGFVWNRLQFAMLREAVWLVETGVATPSLIDEVVRDGLARRWRWTGPFETAALGGAETFTRIAANLWPRLSTAQEIENLARWLSAEPEVLDDLRRRRDAGLLAEFLAERTPKLDDRAGDGSDANAVETEPTDG